MAKVYISDLSENGFKDFEKQIDAFKKKLEVDTNKAVIKLAKLGQEVAVREGKKFSTKLINEDTVQYKRIRTGEYKLVTTNPILTLIECGTGLVGEQSNSKTAQVINYQYRIGSKIKVYTLYFNGVPGEYEGWFYYDEDEGKVRFTQGMPSRPFFSNTASFLKQVGGEMVADELRRRLK